MKLVSVINMCAMHVCVCVFIATHMYQEGTQNAFCMVSHGQDKGKDTVLQNNEEYSQAVVGLRNSVFDLRK